MVFWVVTQRVVFNFLLTLRDNLSVPSPDRVSRNVGKKLPLLAVAYPGNLFGGGGVQQIQLRTEDRENGDLRAVAP